MVRVNIRWGHLDTMPRCAACGRVICSHTDFEFAGEPLDHPSRHDTESNGVGRQGFHGAVNTGRGRDNHAA